MRYFRLKSPCFFWFLLLFFVSCARQIKSPHLGTVEGYYLRGEFAQAVTRLRQKTQRAQSKDRLLYLMEAGSVLHSMEEWRKSNLAFKEAEAIADTITKSVVRQGLSFLLSDRIKNFRGESFERALIKLYLALNYLMLGEEEKAQLYFRRMNIALAEIRELEAGYRENQAARYLYALSAQSVAAYNQARVQYNNLRNRAEYRQEAEAGLYYLSLLSGDSEGAQRYFEAGRQLVVYSKNLVPRSVTNRNALTNLGGLVFLHEAGLAPYKKSRGQLQQDPTFQDALKSALVVNLIADSGVSSPTAFLLSLSLAENPIPEYVERKQKNIRLLPKVELRSEASEQARYFQPKIMDRYTQTILKSYNEQYPSYVKRNVGAIVGKALAVVISTEVAASQQRDDLSRLLTRFLGGFLGGAAVAATTVPDLRAWNLTYDNLQVKWLLLESGEYSLNYDLREAHYASSQSAEVTIQPLKNTYVLVRSF